MSEGSLKPGPGLALLSEFDFGASSYALVAAPGGISWSAAKAEAERLGGALASIETEAENTAVFAEIDRHDAAWTKASSSRDMGPWIGGSRDGDGDFAWESGEPFSFTAWAFLEPNNYGGDETRVHYVSKGYFGSRDATWNDLQDTGVWPLGSGQIVSSFVVEFAGEPVPVEPGLPDAEEIFAKEGKLTFLGTLALAAYGLAPEEPRRTDDGPRNDPPTRGDFASATTPVDLVRAQVQPLDTLPGLAAFTTSHVSSQGFTRNGLDDGIYTNENAAAFVARSADALFLAFRGTNDRSEASGSPLDGDSPDEAHWSGRSRTAHFDLFRPLLESIEAYVRSANSNETSADDIDRIFVTGHSLGGAMVEATMALPGWSDAAPRRAWPTDAIEAIAFASPGFGNPLGRGRDDRLADLWVNGDLLRDVARFNNNRGDGNTIFHELDLPGTALHAMQLYLEFARELDRHGIGLDELSGTDEVPDFDVFVMRATARDADNLDFVIGRPDDPITMPNGRSELIIGGDGADEIRARNWADLLIGGNGNDTLLAGPGHDEARGGAGEDELQGGRGRDTLDGGAGGDTMSGGGGADLFVFDLRGGERLGRDRIEDFRLGTDSLRFLGLDGGLTATERGSDTLIDHEGGRIRLVGVPLDDWSAANGTVEFV